MKQYLDVLDDLLSAPVRGDRTGTGTHSIFGVKMKYENVYIKFPLMTTKKVSLKNIFHELKWMLMGQSNIKYLVDNGVNIWNDWPLKHYNQSVIGSNFDGTDRQLTKLEFIRHIQDKPGFAEQWGDCGPVYGRQWRQWKNLTPTGFEIIDQIANLLNDLKTNPESRRMIVSAWNVADIPEMIPSGLPPCHYSFQCYTREISNEYRRSIAASRNLYPVDDQLTQCGIPERYLDLMVNIRSNDMFLGNPYNTAQYALLIHLLAKSVNMIPGDLTISIGDCHLYLNHVEQAKEQLKRKPFALPILDIVNFQSDPKDYMWEDLQLKNYYSYTPISAPIAV